MAGPHHMQQNVTTNRIRHWRRQRRMTQGDLAARLDTSINTISQFELGKRELTESWMRRIAGALDVPPAALTLDGLAAPQPSWHGPRGLARQIAAGVRPYRGAEIPGGDASGDIDDVSRAEPRAAGAPLPLFATRPRGDGAGTFGILWGQVMEQITRPPGLAGAGGAYCIYMQGSAMIPRFEHGERIYVSPTRPPSVGDDVLVLLDDTRDDRTEQDPVSAHVGRLTRMTDDQVTIAHFRPATDFILDTARIAALHRIYPTAELLGI